MAASLSPSPDSEPDIPDSSPPSFHLVTALYSQLDKPCQLALPSTTLPTLPTLSSPGAPLTLAVLQLGRSSRIQQKQSIRRPRSGSSRAPRRLPHPQTRGHPRCVIGSLKGLYCM